MDGPEDIPGLDNPVVSRRLPFAAAQQLKPISCHLLVRPVVRIVIGGSCPQHILQPTV
ncbi:hypothetical protein O9993_03455 [Vibrio lentus]|nr:hypothetical protein [Vibrio lentus]